MIGGCDSNQTTSKSIETLAGTNVIRMIDKDLVAQGAQVYQRHCASCHGVRGEGDPHWRARGPDGRYPPPPLNGTGHAWHHRKRELRRFITEGSPPGEGNMPAWSGTLSGREIDAVIAWFQSQWPDPVYAAWYDMERR